VIAPCGDENPLGVKIFNLDFKWLTAFGPGDAARDA